ncbi:MOSC domain-containing protein [Gordonia sp. TBRC 11910]|uniref:MOSC domain-containing protein n=1 Tax=Gordonia asplenii TaxID=2725283 RepID=A0A848L291_9ACTN|nr:MOSC domain-containing protein [Gordonia asplenii]NMO04849.1 MOSC domain-containing protein [Gordonia asplenii]
MPELTAICVVRTLHPDSGQVGVTAIDKVPVDGPVKVGPYGAYADVQADRKHHGGLDKALYAYAQEDADYWAAELGRDIPPGFFGENLRTVGIDVNAARIGEQWRIGDKVVVEVTSPRVPCKTFARWMDDEGAWIKKFATARRPGPYLRVIKRGHIRPGDAITVVNVPDAAPMVRDVGHVHAG